MLIGSDVTVTVTADNQTDAVRKTFIAQLTTLAHGYPAEQRANLHSTNPLERLNGVPQLLFFDAQSRN